jgi:hypothetical protein
VELLVKEIKYLKESDCDGAVVIMDEFDDMIVTNPVLVNQDSE